MRLISPLTRLLSLGSLMAIAINLHSSAQPATAQIVTNGSLTVELSGLSNTNGQVCVSLFDSSVGFPDDPEAVVTERCVPADGSLAPDETDGPNADDAMLKQTALSLSFPNLVAGTYAVSVLHDENGDRQINQGAFGIPTEGFGFSRNPTIRTGPPEFYETAVFVFGATTTQIEMIYF